MWNKHVREKQGDRETRRHKNSEEETERTIDIERGEKKLKKI